MDAALRLAAGARQAPPLWPAPSARILAFVGAVHELVYTVVDRGGAAGLGGRSGEILAATLPLVAPA